MHKKSTGNQCRVNEWVNTEFNNGMITETLRQETIYKCFISFFKPDMAHKQDISSKCIFYMGKTKSHEERHMEIARLHVTQVIIRINPIRFFKNLSNNRVFSSGSEAVIRLFIIPDYSAMFLHVTGCWSQRATLFVQTLYDDSAISTWGVDNSFGSGECCI